MQTKIYTIDDYENLPESVHAELETSEPQESRITLNEITLLSKMQAVTRYNLGASSIRKVAEDCGALVRIGKRVAYHRQTLDDFFESIIG